MANKEIEIKLKVKDVGSLLKFLEENGDFKSDKYQRDEYYMPAHRNFIEAQPIKEWLRLRREEGKCSVNYKNWHFNEDGKSYHCDEHETQLHDMDAIKNIFVALNFEPLIVVDKKRKTFMCGDYEVAMDCVEGLGDYVEVEYKGVEDKIDAKEVAEQMRSFIKKTGCEILEQDFLGYPHLLLRQKYNNI
ncbi:MAG: class IV adenylate cyclase [Candidatus Paceibacterota bacterium]|jgi:adenylate cyclase class 2